MSDVGQYPRREYAAPSSKSELAALPIPMQEKSNATATTGSAEIIMMLNQPQ